MHRNLSRIIAWVAVAGWVALGVFSSLAADARDAQVVVVQGSDATTLDGTMLEGTSSVNIAANIYDSLLLRTSDGKIVPNLVESYFTEGDSAWVLKLRRNVKFHNGEPFNAESVKYSIERVLDPAVKSVQRPYFVSVDRVEVEDDYTVKLHTKGPDPALPARLAYFYPVPPRYHREKGPVFAATHPVGTGPYRFVEWVRDEYVLLEANRSYWKGVPSIPRVVFRPIPEPMTRIAALLSGDADIVAGLSLEHSRMLQGQPRVRVASVLTNRVMYVVFNTRIGGPLSDVRVRRALNHAVDVDTIVTTLLDGMGERLGAIVGKSVFGYPRQVVPYKYDPNKARELLAAAGYGQGFALTLHTTRGRYPKDVEIAQAIAGQLAQVGVRVTVRPHEWGEYLDAFTAGRLEAFLMGMGNPFFDADFTYGTWVRSGTGCCSQYDNPQANALVDEARRMVSPTERARFYDRLGQLLYEDAPFLFLYPIAQIYGISERVRWTPRPDDYIMLFDAEVIE